MKLIVSQREREKDGERQVDITVSCLESHTMHFGSNNFEFGRLFVLVGTLL